MAEQVNNQAGNTDTTNSEYQRREGGINNVAKIPASDPGNTSHTEEDVEQQDRHDKPDTPTHGRTDEKQ